MRVVLLCDLTNERWASMDRYALALSAALNQWAPTLDLRLVRPTHCQLTRWVRVERLLTLGWKQVIYPILAGRQSADVYHVVDHSYAHLARYLPARKIVMTCHDLAPLALGEPVSSPTMRLWTHSVRYLSKASRLITPSANTVRDLERFLGIPASKTSVIPYGIGSEFAVDPVRRVAVRQALGVDDDLPVVLHLGTCIPRKNISLLLRALGRLARPFFFLQVGGRFSAADRALIEAGQMTEQVRQIEAAPLDRVVDYYNAADVLVFPSTYEGFGLPPLEAMACGTPVIAANTSSLPEVVGDAGLLVSPDDPQELTSAIQRVLAEPDLAETLRERGLARARQYTWERTARETLAVYEEVWAEARGR